MKKTGKERKSSRKEEKVEVGKPKKEFKIEIVKVGKLEEKTAGPSPDCKCRCYECIVPR